jgi:guanylate kinase
MKTKIIAIMGKAGAGKDYLLRQAIERYPSLHKIIHCTTRPIREREINGESYYFMTEEEFSKMPIIEYAEFNHWFYGTTYSALKTDAVNIGVFSPSAIRQLLSNPHLDVKVFYVDVNAKERLMRQLSREHNPNVSEIIRRYQTDEADFVDLDFSYTKVKNSDFSDLVDTLGALDPRSLWAKSSN